MATRCKHAKSNITTGNMYGYTGGVAARSVDMNRSAHGGVTYTQTCSCGTTRKVNSNGRHYEYGTWQAK